MFFYISLLFSFIISFSGRKKTYQNLLLGFAYFIHILLLMLIIIIKSFFLMATEELID